MGWCLLMFQLECMIACKNFPYPMMELEYYTNNKNIMGLTLFIAWTSSLITPQKLPLHETTYSLIVPYKSFFCYSICFHHENNHHHHCTIMFMKRNATTTIITNVGWFSQGGPILILFFNLILKLKTIMYHIWWNLNWKPTHKFSKNKNWFP